MNFNNILLTIWLINITIPVALAISSTLLNFWSRDRSDWNMAAKWQWIKWKRVIKSDYRQAFDRWDKVGDTVFTLGLFEGVLGAMLFGLIGTAYENLGVISLMIIGSVVLLIFVPRMFQDVAHSIRYNSKTRDSDRLIKLEKEIEEIKGKQ